MPSGYYHRSWVSLWNSNLGQLIRLGSHLLLMSWVRSIPLQALLSGNEVVDDIRETDIGASDEAKEANKEESDIFDKSESVNMIMWYSGWLIVLWCSLTRSEVKTLTSLFFFKDTYRTSVQMSQWTYLVHLWSWVTVSITAGAIKASVELDTDPT